MGIFPSEKEKLKPKIGSSVLRLQFFLNYISPEKNKQFLLQVHIIFQ